MIFLYCFDIEYRSFLHGYFRDKGVRMEAVPPSDFRLRSYALGKNAILIAGKTPSGFICELNPEVDIITVGNYPIGDSVNFREYSDPRLLELLLSYPDSDYAFDCNGILYSSGDEVIFLGYAMKLTPTERSILGFLVSQKERVVPVEEIAEVGMGDPHSKEATVAKHISAINKKAKTIGGRDMIYSPQDHHYRLKKYI